MTLEHETIEEQFKELRQQYQHACNLISGLTELGNNQRQMIERREKTIVDLRMKLVAAECKACKCDQDTYKGC